MSIADIAKDIKNSGFDPRKDKIGVDAGLPAGKYQVVMNGAVLHRSDSGWEQLGYSFEVLEGDFKGRNEGVRHGTLETWVKDGKEIDLSWSVKKTTQFFMKAMALADEDYYLEDLEDGASMAEALMRKSVGTVYTLIIDKGTTKKGKDWTNYDLDLPEEAPNFARDEADEKPVKSPF